MNPDPQPVLQLRDIHLPGDPGFWPPAPGWWLVGAIGVALLAWLTVVALRRFRVHRRRRRILAELAGLERELASEPRPDVLARVAMLLRRLALTRFPRERVAQLSGSAWLDFLDETGGKGRFATGPGRALGAGPYQRSLPSDLDAPRLVALAREWIATNTGAKR